MKAFKFSLQPLRTLRERQEQTALRDYAGAVAARQRAEDKLAAAGRELDGAWSQLHQKIAGGSAARELAQLQDYCATLDQARQQRAEELRVATERVESAFHRLIAARKATAVVDRYYELQRREFLRRRRNLEQKLLDELSQRASARTPACETPAISPWN